MDLCAPLDFDPAANPCGSGLAREGGGSKKSSPTDARESGGSKKSLLTDTPPSRASPLPQWICVPRWISIPPQIPVGAGLLAKAAGQKNRR
ncbi:hypothetical protein CXF97_09280 [Pseudomonas sp. Choline-02u-1]|nr:hypothetical protein CXF97_09280 [Pseudomonas sp. Choline-02u-1]